MLIYGLLVRVIFINVNLWIVSKVAFINVDIRIVTKGILLCYMYY